MSAGAPPAAPPTVWADAAMAAALFAADPAGLGGVAVRGGHCPARARWLDLLLALLPPGAPVRRVPPGIADDRLLGGLDLAATLSSGRPIASRGVLAEADGGVVVLAMAERLAAASAARIAAALDRRSVTVERDGFSIATPTRFGIVALDDGMAEDERPAPALSDRLAFRLDFSVDPSAAEPADRDVLAMRVARARGRAIADLAGGLRALCAGASALGIVSLRPPILALRAARGLAALDGRDAVAEADIAAAARLVLAPRALTLPAPVEEADPPPEAPPEQPAEAAARGDGSAADALDDIVLAAAAAAIPPDLLARMKSGGERRGRIEAAGRAAQRRPSAFRGRPIGAAPGAWRAGARLALVDTLRAAAPWQKLRNRDGGANRRVIVRPGDFRIVRHRRRTRVTTIFVVDASGSTALNRLAETKGAVELLLAECYARRDRVALISFRGKGAELALPPTRSLVRAKRSLAALPGGGATPLAAAIDAAHALARAIGLQGDAPALVFLVDGRANVARDGRADRAEAERDALAAARLVAARGYPVLLVDTATRPGAFARQLAQAMGAAHFPLPHADAGAIVRAAQSAGAAA
jgi:magnesium chelatase subunit D